MAVLGAVGWSRWVTLAASGFAMLCSGPVFTFGAIHTDVKKLLHASELEVQLIGVAGDVGLWTKVFPGLVFDRYGARATVLVGSVLTALGYTLMYFSLVQEWAPAVAAVAWFLAGQGSAFVYTGALFGSTKNFAPAERGFVTGILACLFGTSSMVLSSLLGGCLGGHLGPKGVCSGGFMGGSVTKYMGMLAVVVPVVTVLAGLGTKVREGGTPGLRDYAKLRFRAIFVGVICLIVLIFSKSTVELFVDPSIKTWVNYLVLSVLGLLLLVPAGASSAPAAATPSQEERGGAVTANASTITAGKPTSGAPAEKSALCRPRFWVFFFLFGITVGADLMTLNILAPVAQSRGFEKNVGRFLVVVQMGCDTLARLSVGFLVGLGVPPQGLVLAAPVLTAIGQALLAGGGTPTLYLACCMLGLSDGIMWTMGPLLVGKNFGLAKVGLNFGITVLSASAFQVLLSLVVEPLVYHHNTPPGEEVCMGTQCFAATHWITAALAVVAVALGALLLPPERRDPEGKSTSSSGSSSGDDTMNPTGSSATQTPSDESLKVVGSELPLCSERACM